MNLFAELLASSRSQAGPRIGQNRRGIEVKSDREIGIMRQSGRIVATVLKEIMGLAKPGMTTGDLDAYAEERIRAMGAVPSFKGYHGDSCVTIGIGSVSEEANHLSEVAQQALMQGLSTIKAGNTLMDIAGAVQDHVEANGYAVVEDYTGHGVGRNLHEEPSVFNYRTRELPNITLRAGMTLAVEPILNAGSKYCRTLKDHWTVVTQDGSLSAQWEHTILVTDTGCEILTDRDAV